MQGTIPVGRPLNVQPGKTYSDLELDEAVVKALALHFWIPKKTIHVEVHDGWATMSGTVEWLFQRKGAEDAVAKIVGLRGLTDDIRVECRTVSTRPTTQCVVEVKDDAPGKS
jgi:osmotically-inducible protein OsmY